MNGKETSQGSFLNYTAHEFKKVLKLIKIIFFLLMQTPRPV
jgi:hypothetical protein